MPTECCAQRGRCHLPGEHQATGSASTYSITVADEDSDGDVDVLLGSSWQLVDSDKPSAAQRGGRHLLDKHPDIKLGYSDIAQRVNILDRGGRRVDGDGTRRP